MTSAKITVTYIPNPFESAHKPGGERQEHELLYTPCSLSELMKQWPEISPARHTAVVNGAVVGWDFIPAIDDNIILMPALAGGNTVLGGLLTVAGAVIGVLTSWTGVGAAIGAALISAGAGLLVSDLLKPKVRNPAGVLDNSNTYSFSGIQNSTGESGPVPLVYGRHRVGGVILEANVDNFSGQVSPRQLLTVTVGLSEGEIGGIIHKEGKPEIYINDQPLAYFGNDIWWDYRVGKARQDPLKVVRTQVYMTDLGETGGLYVYTVKAPEAHKFILYFSVTEKTAQSVTIEGNMNGEWVFLGRQTLTASGIQAVTISNTQSVKQLRCRWSDSSRNTALTKIVENAHLGQNLAQIRHYYSIQGVKLTAAQPYIYPVKNSDIAGVRVGLSFQALYESDSNGKIQETSVTFSFFKSKTGKDGSWVHCSDETVTDKSRAAVSHDIEIPVEAGIACIKIERKTADSKSFTLINDSYVKAVTEAESIEIAYNNTALLGLRIEPTDRLSGALPTITALIDGIRIASVRKIVSDKDYSKQTSSNPADIIYDILTHKRYGLGRYLTESRIDMASLVVFAEWCDEPLTYQAYDARTGVYRDISEKRYQLNLVIDGEMSASDALSMICKSTRCLAYWHGDKLRFKIDNTAMPRQLFGMGNIVQDSYTESYIGLAEIPNQVEARFLDESDNFKQHTVSAYDSSRTDEQVNSKTVDLYGVTSYAQVKRELVYALKKVRSVRRFISFEAGIEGVAAEVGDVILFSHDTPQYGSSGRVRAVEGNRIYFDKAINAVSGARHTVVFGTGAAVFRHDFVATSDEILFTDIPDHAVGLRANMPYAAGLLQKEAIPLRVMSLKQTGRFTVKFECEEYNEAVYTLDEDVIIDIPDYSGLGVSGKYVVDGENILPLPDEPVTGMADVPGRVSQITAQEVVDERHGGGIIVSVCIDWEAAALPEGSLSRIEYYAVLVSTEEGKWRTAGTTKAHTFTLPDVAIGQPVKITVKPYTMYGVTNNNLTIVTITPLGQVSEADAPEIIYAVQNGKYVVMKWTAVTNTFLSHYEIRQGTDWAFARRVTTTKTCEIILLASSTGKTNYLVAAVNANGSRGAVASCTVDIDDAHANILYRLDSKENGWAGVYHNVSPVDGELALKASEGMYTTGYIDLKASVTATVSVDYDVAGYNISDMTWADLPFPWRDGEASTPWRGRIDGDCVEHSHDISLFTGLPESDSAICDIIRFADSTVSVKGLRPSGDEENVRYGYGTFHKGLKRGDIRTQLTYPLASPAQWTWSVWFRYSLKGVPAKGVLVQLGDASVVSRGNGRYRLSAQEGAIEIKLVHDLSAQLLFCVSVMNEKVYFAVGDTVSGVFASDTRDIGFSRFESITV